jgi:Holliday junction DNA helicase RuvA
VSELKDRLADGLGAMATASEAARGITEPGEGTIGAAVSALANLGYGRSEALAAVSRAAAQDQGATVEALIRTGLKELSQP